MDHHLKTLAARFTEAGSDFSAIWSVVTNSAADIVEIRHTPPSHLDGWRSRADFIRYVEEEGRVFPQSFTECHISLAVEAAVDRILWNPLSLAGNLVGSGREVDIRFRVELEFSRGTLIRVIGSPAPENDKSDLIAWLKAVDSIGGFNPPPASPHPTQA